MKKIEEHTKKKLMSVVRDYNLHHAIRNYSKLKKADLIKKMVKYVAYNENTHQFTRRKKLKSRPMDATYTDILFWASPTHSLRKLFVV